MSGEIVHRLGAAVGILSALTWSVRWLVDRRRRRRLRRRLAGLRVREAPAPVPRLALRGVARRWLAPVGVACAGWALVGGPIGVAVGLAGAVGLWRWRLRQEAADTDGKPDLAEAARQLPPPPICWPPASRRARAR